MLARLIARAGRLKGRWVEVIRMAHGVFRATIQLGNDAMQDPGDVADALERVAAKLRDTGTEGGSIRDENGSIVGVARFEMDD